MPAESLVDVTEAGTPCICAADTGASNQRQRNQRQTRYGSGNQPPHNQIILLFPPHGAP